MSSRMRPFVVIQATNTSAPLDPCAAIELADIDKGFLPNRLTTVQRDAIANPTPGLTIYNTDTGQLETWDGNRWNADAGLDNSSSNIVIRGDAEVDGNNIVVGLGATSGTSSDSIVIGTNAGSASNHSAQDVFIGTNAGVQFNSGGTNVGIGQGALYGIDAVVGGGGGNVAIGVFALARVDQAFWNVVIGQGAGVFLKNGGSNVVIGVNAGGSLVNGGNNVIIATGNPTVNIVNSNDNIIIGNNIGTVDAPDDAGKYLNIGNEIKGRMGANGRIDFQHSLGCDTAFYLPTAINEPVTPSSGWVLYVDAADGNKLKAKASTGTVVSIATP